MPPHACGSPGSGSLYGMRTASAWGRLAVLLLVMLSAGCRTAIDPLAIEDAQTAVRVRTALLNDPALGVRAIDVRVNLGVVTLTGTVQSQDEIDRAVALARAVDGVRDVMADLRIGPTVTPAATAPSTGAAAFDDLLEPQGDPRLLAVGVSLGWSGPRLRRLDQHVSVGPLFRLGSGRGFGPTLALNWFQTNISSDPGDVQSRISVKPLMVGVGYTMASERVSVSPSLVGGVAFNSLTVPDTGEGERVAVEVGNSLVWRPGVSVWFDTSRRFAVNVSAGYVFTGLKVTFLEGGQLVRRKVSGDATIVHVGLAYKLF